MILDKDKEQKVRVFSVPGSGTNSLLFILRNAGLGVHQRHYGAPPRQVFRDMTDWPRASSIRRPEDNWVTFYAIGHHNRFSFKQCWMEFNERFLKDEELLILPVDHPERDNYLNHMEEQLGVKLQTDWEPQNSRPEHNHDLEISKEDMDFVYELEVVKKFYEREKLPSFLVHQAE